MPKSAQPWVLALLRAIFDQPDASKGHAQFDRVIEAPETKLPVIGRVSLVLQLRVRRLRSGSLVEVDLPGAAPAR